MAASDPATIAAVREHLALLGCDVAVPDALITDFLQHLARAPPPHSLLLRRVHARASPLLRPHNAVHSRWTRCRR